MVTILIVIMKIDKIESTLHILTLKLSCKTTRVFENEFYHSTKKLSLAVLKIYFKILNIYIQTLKNYWPTTA